MEAQESPDVQNHIRSLVYDYAKEHITSDYDKYTIEHANQLLSNGLKTISSLGPTDLTPLVDPMQALLRQWNLSSNGTLAYGEEKLTVPPQTMAYLRRMLAPQNQPVRRDPFVYDEKIYSHAAQRPYHTIISRRAQNATPNIGKGTDRAGVPRTFVDLVEHHCIKAVHIDPVVEPPIDQEKILSLRSPIDIPTQAGIKVLFESLPSTINQRNKAIGKLASRYVNSNSTLDSFLRCPSPTPTCPRPMTPPIFTRTSYRSDVTQAPTGKTLGPTDFADFMEIVRRTDKMLQPIKANDNKIFDIAKENLIIVNGWS